MEGNVLDPINQLWVEHKKGVKAGKGKFTKAEFLIQRLRNTIKENPRRCIRSRKFSKLYKKK